MAKTLLEQFEDLLPLPPIWQGKRIIGSMMFFDMGEKIEMPKIKLPDFVKDQDTPDFRGRFVLTIELGDWNLYQGDTEILNNDCEDDDVYEKILASLCGQSLIEIRTNEDIDLVEFRFSHDWVLQIFSNLDVYKDDDDIFSFHELGGFDISYCNAHGFYAEDKK